MKNQRPFSAFMACDTGIKRSSVTLLDHVESARALGQAGINLGFNIINGNVFVEDLKHSIETLGFNFKFGMVYNSLASTPSECWRFSLVKKIDTFNGDINTPDSAVSIAEEDGSFILCEFDNATKQYIARGLFDGNYILTVNPDRSCELLSKGNGTITRFSSTGLQTEIVDRFGRRCQFEYDDHSNLKKIQLPSNESIEFVAQDHVLQVTHHQGDVVKTLAQYTFDQGGLLQTTNVSLETNQYTITYGYDAATGYLNSIQQTDGTKVALTYQQDNGGAILLNTIQVGDDLPYQIQYQENQTNILDPLDPSKMTEYGFIEFKDEFRLSQIKYANNESIQFNYNELGMPKEKIYGSGATSRYAYDANGLRNSVQDAFNHVTQTIYDPNTGLLISKIAYTVSADVTTALIQRFVYNDQLQLRYEISANGLVTEHEYDDLSNRISSRAYLNGLFDSNHYAIDQVIPEADLSAWCQAEDITKTRLMTFEYNQRGQCTIENHYNTLDANGAPVFDDQTQVITRDWDPCGNRLSESRRQTKDADQKDEYQYDGLQRLCLHTNALKEKTQMTYLDAEQKIQTQFANGLLKTVQTNASGLAIAVTESADGVLRQTSYRRNGMGNTYERVSADGQKHHEIYDIKSRLQFAIDPKGYVTEYVYDDRDHLTETINYAEPLLHVDTIDWKNKSHLNELLISIGKDRKVTSLYDFANRLRYRIDAEDYVTEIQYDDANRQIATITYATRLPETVARTLINNQLAVVTSKDDRIHRFYLDKDGHTSGEQDAAGFVVEFLRNAIGDVLDTIRYAKSTLLSTTLAGARPEATPNQDAHQRVLRNRQGQVVASINAESYLTVFELLPSGFPSTKRAYAIAIENTTIEEIKEFSELKPVPDSEDQTTEFTYDLLNREIVRVEKPLNYCERTAYDVMSNVVYTSKEDLQNPNTLREVRTRYNAWSQKTATIDARLSVQYRQIEENTSISEEERQRQLEQLWRDQSDRQQYEFSGLLIQSLDVHSHATIRFYDENRALKYRINPKGYVTHYVYESFTDNYVQRIHYATPLTAEQMKGLVGGIADAATDQLIGTLKNAVKDSVLSLSYDRRGLVVKTIDAESYSEEKTINAFREVITILKMIDRSHQLKTVMIYEKRSLMITKTIDPEGLAITTQKSFDHLSQLILWTDENNYSHTYENDRLGRQLLDRDPNNKTRLTIWDAFNRPLAKKNRNDEKIIYQYESINRKTMIVSAEQRVTIIEHNGFKETIKTTNNNQHSQSFAYEFGGERYLTTDELNRREEKEFDFAGYQVLHRDPLQIESRYQHDETGQLKTIIDDPLELQVKIEITKRDHQLKEIARINAVGVAINHERDRLGLVKATIIDPRDPQLNPEGLHEIEAITYNGLQQPVSMIKGDFDHPNQYEEAYGYDSAARKTTVVVDPITAENPNGLQITNIVKLDKAGNTIAEIDGNGNCKRFYYDTHHHEILRIDAMGQATATIRDGEGRILEIRVYAYLLNPAWITDHTEINSLPLVPSDEDQVTYQRFDRDGQLKFIINSSGAVTEFHLDAAGREIGKTHYMQLINTQNIKTTSADEIKQLIVKTPNQDVTTYTILDAAGQLRFEIDARGVVTEHQYNAVSKPIAHFTYANPIDTLTLTLFTPEEINGKLIHKEQHIAEYDIYDRLHRRVMHIDGERYVTQYIYDADDHEIELRVYFIRLANLPATFDEASVLSLLNTSGSDYRVTKTTVNALGLKQAVMDTLGNSDQYTYNIHHAVKTHIDKANNVWEFESDRAGREILERGPEITVANVSQDQSSSQFKLVLNQIKARVEKKKSYDNNKNLIAVTEASNFPDARTVKMSYNTDNQPLVSSYTGMVDDPTKIPTLNNRPDTLKTLSQQKIYNVFKKVMVSVNEAGALRFTVYNQSNREIYVVDEEGYVTEIKRDALQREIQVTHYAKPLNCQLQDYATIGLTEETITQSLIKTPNEDRSVINEYDLSGHKVRVTFKGDAHFLTIKDGKPQYAKAQLKMETKINSYGLIELERTLKDPLNNIWAEHYSYFDANKKQIAMIDPKGYVTIWERNVDGVVTDEKEYANAIDLSVIPKNIDELKALCESQISANDRHKRYEFDKKGRVIKEIMVGIVTHQPGVDANGKPVITEQPKKDLVTAKEYGVCDDVTKIIEASGAVHLKQSDAYGREVVVKSPARDTEDSHDQPISYIEVLQKGYNPFGQEVVRVRDVEVPSNHVGIILEDDIAEMSQQRLLLTDPRGLVIAEQSDKNAAETMVRFMSHTATKQSARRWQWVTGWSDTPMSKPAPKSLWSLFYNTPTVNADYSPVQRLHQDRFGYNPRGQKTLIARLKRDGSEELMIYRINGFAEITGIDPGDNSWPVKNQYDLLGRVWFSNQNNGVPTIHVYDGLGKETAAFAPGGREGAIKIADQTEDDIPKLITADYSQLTQTFIERDLNSNVVAQYQPKFQAIKRDAPEPIHTNFLIGRNFAGQFGVVSISWPEPANQFLVGRMKLWVKDKEGETPIVLNATRQNGRMGVDVSQLTTDYYTYELTYYMQDALTNFINYDIPIYQVHSTDLPIDTGNNANSQHAVIMKTGPAILTITGKAGAIAGIALYKNNELKGRFAASYIDGDYRINLNEVPSGTYTAKLITAMDKIDAPVFLNTNSEADHRIEIHQTKVIPANSKYFIDGVTIGNAMTWRDLPPRCTTLQGRFNSFDVETARTGKVGAKITAGNWVVETFGSNNGSHTFNYQKSGSTNYPGGMMQLYALDSGHTPYYLGQATQLDNLNEKEALPYIYVVPNGAIVADALALIDTNGNEYAVLQLMPWMDGMYRVCVDGIANINNYKFQILRLSATIEQSFETTPFVIESNINSDEIISRELLVEDSYCDVKDAVIYYAPIKNIKYLIPRVKVIGDFNTDYLNTVIICDGNVKINASLGYGVGKYAMSGNGLLGYIIKPPVPFEVVINSMRVSIVKRDNTVIPLFDSIVNRKEGERYYFRNHVTLISPIPNNTVTVKIEWFDHTLGRDSEWVPFNTADFNVVPGYGIVINTLQMQSGVYEFKLQAFDSNNNQIPIGNGISPVNDGWYHGYMNINSSAGLIATPNQSVQYELLSPVVKQVTDRFGNVIEQVDPRGFKTKKSFNHNNQPVVIEYPEVEITAEDASIITAPTTKQFFYNDVDDVIGLIDENGHPTVHFLNACHEVTKTVLADGYFKKLIRDGFGRTASTANPLGHKDFNQYDKQDAIIGYQDPAGIQSKFSVNERRDRVEEINPIIKSTKFDTDHRHNTTVTILPSDNGSIKLTTEFDRNNFVLVGNALKGFSPITYNRDYFGHIKSYTDTSGALYNLSYTEAWILTKIQQKEGTGNHGQQYALSNKLVSVPPKNIDYKLNETGVIEKVVDIGADSRTAYHLNENSRRIGERYFAFDGREHQGTYMNLNSRDWLVKLWDIRAEVSYAHDAKGNRRRTRIAFAWESTLSAKAAIESRDNWYRYNEADLLQIAFGTLTQNRITISAGRGIEVTYDKGQRIQTQRTKDASGRDNLKTITYAKNTDLVSTISDVTGKGVNFTDTFEYDWVRRKKHTRTSTDTSDAKENYTEASEYNSSGFLKAESRTDKSQNSNSTFSNHDAEGNPYEQITVIIPKDKDGKPVPDQKVTDTYHLDYLGFDSVQLSKCSGKRKNKDEETDIKSVYVTFDANGLVRSLEGDSGNVGGRAYIHNAEGVMVCAQEGKVFSKDDSPNNGAALLRTYNFADTEGHLLGSIGNIPQGVQILNAVKSPAYVNFDLGVHLISGATLAQYPSYYVPVQGDLTFEMISLKIFGDRSYAGDIAKANHMEESDKPPIGRRLMIPPTIMTGKHNFEGMYAVWDENKIIGSYYPYLPVVRIHPKKTNFFEIFIEIFIETLVMFLLPGVGGAVSGFLSQLGFAKALASIIGYSIAGFTLGANADALEQLTLIAFGDQKGFSMKHLLKAAFNQAELAAVGGMMRLNPNILRNSVQLEQALKGVVVIGVTQLLRMATGEQKRFSWQDMIATTLITMGNLGINRMLENEDEGILKEFYQDLFRVGLTQGIDSAVYHQGFDPEVYAATLLGTFAGTMAAKPLDARLTAYNENKAYQQQEAQEQKAYAAKAAEALKANEDQFLRKRGYIGYTSAADDYLDDQAQQIMNGSSNNADGVARASQNSASMFSRKPVQTSTPRSQSYDARQQRHQDVDNRAYNKASREVEDDAFHEVLHNPLSYIAPTIESAEKNLLPTIERDRQLLQSQLKIMNQEWLRLEARFGIEMQADGATMNALRQAHWSQASEVIDKLKYLERIGIGIEYLKLGATPFELAVGAIETGVALRAAAPEDRERVLYNQVFKTGGEIVGGSVGGFLGITAGTAVGGGPVGGFVGGIAGGVYGAAKGAEYGQIAGEYIYQYHKSIDPALKITTVSFFPTFMQPAVERELNAVGEYLAPGKR